MAETNHFVKTTISVPGEVYARATRRAKELEYQPLGILCRCGRKGAQRDADVC